MLGVYTFVFGVVFRGGWPHPRANATIADFALAMFSGQIAFNLVAEPLGRASSLVTSSPNLVKKVIFPLEILPISAVATAMVHAGIALLILLIGSGVVYQSVPWTFILAPFALVPLALLALGLTWFLASLGVYLRDVGFVVGVVLQILMFSSPVFYPISAVPEAYRPLLMANPLTPGIEMLRSVTIAGIIPDIFQIGWAFSIGIASCLLGYLWFQKTRKGFADVL